MKKWLVKAWKYAGAFCAGIAAAVLAAAAYLAGSGMAGKKSLKTGTAIDDGEIDHEADKARMDAADRIAAVPARTLCEGYGTVCDAIADGRERFRQHAAQRRQGTEHGGMAEDD
jgi:hypothetical protein